LTSVSIVRCSRLLLLVLACLLLLTRPSLAANDPGLLWQSLETKHFRISFYSGERQIAEHVADLAETIYERLGDDMDWYPRERVEIAISDQTESANGSATAIPLNIINLYVTAPDDLSPLGDVDDWYLELLTHEYTHTLQLDQVRGFPALVNAILGRTWMPNQIQPRWILEGLAVLQETAHTSGGRMRSGIWEMMMRTDVLTHNVASIDQMHHYIRRWPQGNVWYLYGSYFMRFIVDTYGIEAIQKMIRDYGAQPIPWGFNRSLRRATGQTFEELYPAWVRSLEKQFGAQQASIRAAGIREGTRITFHGQGATYPRWVPKNAWAGYDLVYDRDDGHSRGGLYGLSLNKERTKALKNGENLVRLSGSSPASFLPNGDVVFSSLNAFRNIFSFNDLHRIGAGKTSPSGMDGEIVRLTEGFRASEPTVSPDGAQIVFVSNNRGTRSLQIADLRDTTAGVSDGEEALRNVRTLVASQPYEQVFTPRFSPDGRNVVSSVWSHGGYRDVRIVDIKTHVVTEVTHDRAMDGGTSFSPDGKYVLFHSDRTGVFNLYAWEIATQKLWQMSNVETGAFYPELSPDGATVAYVGYTNKGFDLYTLPFDPSRFWQAAPYVDRHPSMPVTAHHEKKLVPYNPLHTLLPRKYSAQYTQGSFGNVGIVSVLGSDVAGRHSVALTMASEFSRPQLQGSLVYTYGAMPFDVSFSAYRNVVPTRDFRFGQNEGQLSAQESVGVDTSVGFTKNRMFDSQSFNVGYSAARIANDVAYLPSDLNPYETPGRGTQGFTGFLHASYRYSNAERYLHSVSSERGISFGFDAAVTHPGLGSEFRGFTARSDLNGYVPMPWLQHHVLALHGGAGMGGGGYPGRSLFYVGGFTDISIIDTLRTFAVQGGVVLRGYEPVAITGNYFAQMNAEYRFPILNLDRGVSTLPIFLNRISGNAFFDYGSAFDDPRLSLFKTGVGAEAWFDLIFGYNLGLTMRLGFARGLASGGFNKPYFVAVVPY
jgi:hypothetical protein